MATAALQSQPNLSNYYLKPQGPSSSETYMNNHNISSSSPPMANERSSPEGNIGNPDDPHWKGNWRRSGAPEHYGTDVKQLRRRRQPLYVPAALRPTDPGVVRSIPTGPRLPDTPPRSQGNSFDSANLDTDPFATATLPPDGTTEQLRQEGSQIAGISAAFGPDAVLEEVTGPPTTAHWKPDATANNCFVCAVPFTWWFRRHHCRRCGNVVCDNHIKHKVPLDQNARFHPHGQESKACNRCYEEWRVIKKMRGSRASSIVGSSAGSQDSTAAAVTIPKNKRLLQREEQRVGSVAHSEGGMIWSTF